jgi:hypothetical protein
MSIIFRLISIIFVVTSFNRSYSQNISSLDSSNVQSIIIIGTYHPGNKNMTGDSLYTLIKKISPDAILTEAITYKMKIPFFVKIAISLGIAHHTIEYYAEKKISENGSYPTIYSYDINMNRSQYVKETSKKNKRMWRDINKFINSPKISVQQKNIFIKYISIDNFLRNYYTTKDLYAINRQNIIDSSEKRMEILYNDILPILKANTSVKKWADYLESEKKFWDYRNIKMAENIIAIIKSQVKNRRIIILSGFLHKYYLQKLLIPLQKENNFKLKDLKWLYDTE